MSATFDGSCLQDRRSSTLLILVANTNDGFGGGGSLYSAGGLVTLEYSVSGVVACFSILILHEYNMFKYF